MQSRSARALSALAVVVAYALAAVLVSSCSNGGGGSTAPTPPGTGPTFSFAFPAAGTAAVPGTSNQRTFTSAEVGSWTYHCIPHEGFGMVGTVVVDSNATRDSAVIVVGADTLGNNLFRFTVLRDRAQPGGGSTVTIRPSTVAFPTRGKVRWVNWSAMTVHTATR
jgi:hypothetical protein